MKPEDHEHEYNEQSALTFISNKKNKRNDIAFIYSRLIKLSFKKGWKDSIDFKKVNIEILKRYKVSGLIYIKEKAWKIYLINI